MERIQRSRKRGWRKPANSVYVGRGSKWGNPFKVKSEGLETALKLYEKYLDEKLKLGLLDLNELKGKDLMCWCRLDSPCHADILLRKCEELKQ